MSYQTKDFYLKDYRNSGFDNAAFVQGEIQWVNDYYIEFGFEEDRLRLAALEELLGEIKEKDGKKE